MGTNRSGSIHHMNPHRRPFSQDFAGPEDICDLYLDNDNRRSIRGEHALPLRRPAKDHHGVDGNQVMNATELEEPCMPTDGQSNYIHKHNNKSNSLITSHSQSGGLENKHGSLEMETSETGLTTKDSPNRFIRWKNGDTNGTIRRPRRLQSFILGIFVFLLFVALLLFFLWPRKIQISAIDVERHDRYGNDGQLVYANDGMITLNTTNTIMGAMNNPNFVMVEISNIEIVENWVMMNGNKTQLGNVVVNDFSIPQRSSLAISIPYIAEYTEDPLTDPIFRDLYQRCVLNDKEEERMINIEYEIMATISYLGVKRHKKVVFLRSFSCQSSPDQMEEIFKTADTKLKNLPDAVVNLLKPSQNKNQ